MAFKSEYQRQFIEDKDGSAKENYKSMLQFRNKKKSYELRHTPLIWLDSHGNIDNELSPRVNKNTVHDDTFTMDEEVSCDVLVSSMDEDENNDSCRKNKSVQADITITKKDVIDVGVQSPDPHNPDKRRPKSSRRCGGKVNNVVQDKPVIAYGWADKSSIQKKKTFNVKAPKSEVRRSALRAAMHRENQKRIKFNKKEIVMEEKLKKQVLINSLTDFNCWQTEYRKQFCR